MGRVRTVILAALVALTVASCAPGGARLPLQRAAAPKPTTPPQKVTVEGLSLSRPVPPPPVENLWPAVDLNVQLGPPPYHIAEVMAPAVDVYDSPTAAVPRMRLPRKSEHGEARVFLTVAPAGDRYEVLLPVRPNGAVGWVPTSQVNIEEVTYWVRVQTAAHTMTVGDGTQLVDQEPVAVGTGGTPTPLGTFYLVELLKPIGEPWLGPFAYTLSAHSNVLHSFMGGDGTVGLHGTDTPGSIGRAASHGCIRVSNGGISKLATTLPLGTPVFVTP